MKYTYYAFGLGAAAIGLVGYRLGHHSTDPGATQSKIINSGIESQSDDSRLAEVIARIEQRLSVLEARQVARLAAPPNAAASGAVSEPIRERDPQDIEDHQARRSAEIARRLSTESRDRSWAAATEEQIQTAIEASSAGGHTYAVSNLSCLTSICKVEVSTPDLKGAFGALHSMFLNVHGMAGLQSSQPVKAADGSYKVAYELFRSGYPEPGLE